MRLKTLNFVVILSILLSLSCSWITPSIRGQQPSRDPSATPHRVDSTQVKSKEVTPTPSDDNFQATKITDASGRATVIDPAVNNSRDFLVKDSLTDTGIGNIELTYVSDGKDFLIFVFDPEGKYVPTIYDSESLTSAGTPKLARVKEQGITEIVIVLTLLSAVQTVDDFIALFKHPPRLEKWGWFYEDTCWTGEQMGQVASVGLFGLTTFFGVPGFDDIGQAVFKIADQALLDMLKVAQMGAEYEGQQRLVQFNGILRWRVYHVPVGILPAIITPLGYCLDPLDATNTQSVVDWVNYALQYNEVMPLERLAATELGYVNYIEGGQGITRVGFLSDMEERLPGKPVCEGYAEDDYQLQVWTSNWSPPLIMTELCYVGCNPIDPPWKSQIAAFLFYREKGNRWALSKVWLNEPSEYSNADGVGLIGCDHVSPPSLRVENNTPTSTPSENCPGALPSRLKAGEYAYVIPEPPVPNRVRSGPGSEYDIVGEAQPGAAMSVLSGPRCSNGWSWWEVSVQGSGLRGWTAEGDASEYWLAPCSNLNSCR